MYFVLLGVLLLVLKMAELGPVASRFHEIRRVVSNHI